MRYQRWREHWQLTKAMEQLCMRNENTAADALLNAWPYIRVRSQQLPMKLVKLKSRWGCNLQL
jgi:hypothetical protein